MSTLLVEAITATALFMSCEFAEINHTVDMKVDSPLNPFQTEMELSEKGVLLQKWHGPDDVRLNSSHTAIVLQYDLVDGGSAHLRFDAVAEPTLLIMPPVDSDAKLVFSAGVCVRIEIN